MPNYEHDILVSYRRSDQEWVRWTRDNLVRVLRSLLRPGLGDVSLYMDENIETGASWPGHLALNHARSKLLVAVLSRDYFQSDWCRLELALMYAREKEAGFRTRERPSGLIIPLIIDDGDQFPAEIQEMQGQRLHSFANPFIRPDSPKQEELAEVLRTQVCPTIERMLGSVPEFKPEWETRAYECFQSAFRIQVQQQRTVPSLTLPGIL